MRTSSKKGFTIVELVIVIAVIAILAAVLIPTFTGIVKKARLSNDQSMIRNMNTTITAAIAEGSIPKDGILNASDAIQVLNENGFTGKYTPYSSGYHYGFHLGEKTMCLVDETNEIVYPENMADVAYTELWFLYSGAPVDKVAGATKYVSLINIDNGGNYVTHFGDGLEYDLDLGDHYLNVTIDTDKVANITVQNGVLISGATSGANTIALTPATSADVKAVIDAAEGATVTIENKVFTDANVIGGKTNVIFKNCYFYNSKTSGCSMDNVTFDGCKFIDSDEGGYIFNVQGDVGANSKYYAGTLTVKNCEFINCARVFNIPVYVLGEDAPGKIVITGNTFHAVTGKDRGVIQMCSQKNSGATADSEKGYIDITISNNNFTGIASTQAGLIILHESIVPVSGISTDKITVSGNTIASTIKAEKYVVNDDGKADTDEKWADNYNIGDFKAALAGKFN